MTLEPSAWRANDTVAFELAREAANTATAVFFDLVDRGDLNLKDAIEGSKIVRRELLELNGFDRAAIDTFTKEMDERVTYLTGIRNE